MLSRVVIAFLPRSKHLLISWLQSPSTMTLEPKKIKSATVSTFSPSICLLPSLCLFSTGHWRGSRGLENTALWWKGWWGSQIHSPRLIHWIQAPLISTVMSFAAQFLDTLLGSGPHGSWWPVNLRSVLSQANRGLWWVPPCFHTPLWGWPLPLNPRARWPTIQHPPTDHFTSGAATLRQAS